MNLEYEKKRALSKFHQLPCIDSVILLMIKYFLQLFIHKSTLKEIINHMFIDFFEDILYPSLILLHHRPSGSSLIAA